jgi:hypothetical protein
MCRRALVRRIRSQIVEVGESSANEAVDSRARLPSGAEALIHFIGKLLDE